ncbi:MAG TPA: ATPase, partial [Nitrospirae bacterium]|nr:ATPase [Nitrospirota bacterium]
MYERFFHLKTKPFELVPNPAFIYLSKTHKKAITYLDYGVREKAGFILLTGEVGSGKTTL